MFDREPSPGDIEVASRMPRISRILSLAPELGAKVLSKIDPFFEPEGKLPKIRSLNLKGPRIIHVTKRVPAGWEDIPLYNTRPGAGQIAISGLEYSQVTQEVIVPPDSH